LSQAERGNAMQALRDGRANVCVATDVAARGIDLPGLDLVIHADLPSNAETLLHRSGRTGRAGRKGRSVLIVPGRHRPKAQRLLKAAKLEAEWGAPPSAKDVLAKEEERIIAGPALREPLDPEESAFAERLLTGRTPEQVAAAYLRLYREHHSAPESLGAAPEAGKRAKVDHSDFGPSTWFSLSLGRKDRAEPRWLLPMLCRNAGLAKSTIGAIRVQYQETFVEIATDAIPALKRELGEELTVEQGAVLTELEGLPDFDASPAGPPPAPRDRTKAEKRPKDRATPEPQVKQPRKYATADKQEKRKKNTAGPSKSSRTGKKATNAAKHKAKSARPPKRKSDKGGEARPFRKRAKNN
ncbi:MAG: C-terminal helicase domain-containing protein, partial [Pseudomonadota bacterium]